MFAETSVTKSRDYCDSIVFEKLYFSSVFLAQTKTLAISNPSGLTSVFEKQRFLDGLVWTVGQTVENKAAF